MDIKAYNDTDILENEKVSEYFTRKKRDLSDCNFVKWLNIFFMKIKKEIIYNVYLTKEFTHEMNGGMKYKNKTKNKTFRKKRIKRTK